MRPGAGPLDAELPLEALDRALSPVRRVVRYAVQQQRRPAHMGLLTSRQLQAAAALDLPEAMLHAVQALSTAAAGLDEAPDEQFQERVAEVFAELARLDAVAGLPARRAIRPVHKKRVDYGAPDAGAATGGGATATAPPRPERSRPAAADAPAGAAHRPERAWSGRFDVAVGELLDLPEGSPWADQTLEELLLTLPVSEEVLLVVHGAGRELPEGRVAVGGRARGRVTVCHPRGARSERVRLQGAAGLWVAWAEPLPHPSLVPAGERLVVVGTLRGDVLVDAEVARPLPDGSVVLHGYEEGPEAEIADRARRQILLRVADRVSGESGARDPVSADTLRRLDLPGRATAWLGLHRGSASSRERRSARRRVAFDEALWVALATGAPRYPALADRGVPHTLLQTGLARLAQRHDVVLTDAQQLVLEEIKRDLRRGTPMRRVITGEVGSGKGRLALSAMVMVAEGKSQVLVVGPDDAEADQRFQHSEPLLRDLGIVARRLDDDPGRAQRDALKRGEIHVVFGTHALLKAELGFRKLGLVVSVERFPFGAAASSLPTVTPRPDLLVTTQIPVGARVLMAGYADFDASVVVDEQRRPAEIRLGDAARRDEAYAVLREQVARGHQGMVLFPRIRHTDALDLAGAQQVLEALSRDALQGLRLALLHGSQPLEERRRVFDDLVHRRIDVLVSTLAVEDGPTVPGVTAAVIEQADRVQQWRLHRIIGFLSATPHPSVAVLVVGERADADAQARIERVLSAPNGYALTESLVALEGVAAHIVPTSPPLPELTWLDLDADRDLVLAAREEAHRVLRADPGLRRGSHLDLAQEVRNAWDALWPDAEGWDWVVAPSGESGPGADRRKRRRRRRRK